MDHDVDLELGRLALERAHGVVAHLELSGRDQSHPLVGDPRRGRSPGPTAPSRTRCGDTWSRRVTTASYRWALLVIAARLVAPTVPTSIGGCPPSTLHETGTALGAGPTSAPWLAAVRWSALGLYVVGCVVFLWWQGIPTDRLGLALAILVLLSIAVLGRGWAAWWQMMRDWLPFEAVLLPTTTAAASPRRTRPSRWTPGQYSITGVHNGLGLPLHVEAPIRADLWIGQHLGMGGMPTTWLQEHLHPGHVDAVVLGADQPHLLQPLPGDADRRRRAVAGEPRAVPGLDADGRGTRGGGRGDVLPLPDGPALAGQLPLRLPGPARRSLHLRRVRPDRPAHGRRRPRPGAVPRQPGRRDAVAAHGLRDPRGRVLLVRQAVVAEGACSRSTRSPWGSPSCTAASTTSSTSSPASPTPSWSSPPGAACERAGAVRMVSRQAQSAFLNQRTPVVEEAR